MSVAIYMDEHVPAPITLGLRERGVDVLTAQEDGHGGDPDEAVLSRATALNRVLFTQDQGFFREASERQEQGAQFAGIFFAAQHRLSYRQLIEDLEYVAKCSQQEDWVNQINSLPLT